MYLSESFFSSSRVRLFEIDEAIREDNGSERKEEGKAI